MVAKEYWHQTGAEAAGYQQQNALPLVALMNAV